MRMGQSYVLEHCFRSVDRKAKKQKMSGDCLSGRAAHNASPCTICDEGSHWHTWKIKEAWWKPSWIRPVNFQTKSQEHEQTVTINSRAQPPGKLSPHIAFLHMTPTGVSSTGPGFMPWMCCCAELLARARVQPSLTGSSLLLYISLQQVFFWKCKTFFYSRKNLSIAKANHL